MLQGNKFFIALSLLAGAAGKLSQIHFIDNADSDPLMHYNLEHSKPGPLFPTQVTESIARVMGISSPVGSSFSNLPSGDVFNSPEMNLVLAIDGTSDLEMADTLASGGPAHSFTVTRMSKAQQPLVLEAMGESLESPLTHTEGLSVTCASGSDWFLNSQVCEKARKIDAESTAALCSEPLPEKLHSAAARAGYTLSSKSAAVPSGECPSVTVSGPAGSVEFDLTNELDSLFFEEMSLLAKLPELLGDKEVAEQITPALKVVSIGSLEALLKEYEAGSLKGQVAAGLADSSVAQLVEAVFEKFPGKVVGQVIRTPQGNAAQAGYGYLPWQKPHRFLAAVNGTNSTTNSTEYTLTEIRDYQIALWTAVMLIFAVFAAIMLTACMNIEPDSILYAKFQADTTGLKMD